MNNNYSIAERNKIVEEHLWCIKAVMKQNRELIRVARLDSDDVYQQLAERLIRAVRTFDPDKGDFLKYIFHQLHYELLDMKTPRALYGITKAPTQFRGSDHVSLNAMYDDGGRFFEREAA